MPKKQVTTIATLALGLALFTTISNAYASLDWDIAATKDYASYFKSMSQYMNNETYLAMLAVFLAVVLVFVKRSRTN